MRREKVPLQTVISLKAINKSSSGKSEEIVGYELKQDKPQEFVKNSQVKVDKAKRTEVKLHLSVKQSGNLRAIGTGRKKDLNCKFHRCQNQTRKGVTKHILVTKT